MTRSREFWPVALTLTSGFLVWAAHFAMIYGLTALACARGFNDAKLLGLEVVPLGVGAATLAALLMVVWVIMSCIRWRGPRREDALTRFLRYTTILIGGFAILAIVWDGLPAILIGSPCR